MPRTRFRALLLLPLAAACSDAPKAPVSRAGGNGGEAAGGEAAARVAAELNTRFATGRGLGAPLPAVPGETVTGTLAVDSAGLAWQPWTLTVTEPSVVTASMASGELDAFLSLHRGEPGRLATLVAWDDDGGGGTDARLSATIPAGSYTLLAGSLAGAGGGGYGLALELRESESGSTRVLRPGVTLGASLTAAHPTFDDGAHYEEWEYRGTAGERLTVTMTSSTLDPFLVLHRGTPHRGVFMAEDDDGGGGLAARVSVTLPATGSYTVVAASHAPGETGEYALRVETTRPPLLAYDNTGLSSGGYALLVAVGENGDEAPALQDARGMRDALVDRFGFRDEDIVLLSGPDATRENVANGILQHLGQAGPEGVAVFFYAGAGIRTTVDVALTPPLDPVTGGDRDAGILVRGPDGGYSVLADEELGWLLGSLPAGRALAVLGACPAPGGTEVRLPTNFVGAEPGVVDPDALLPPAPDELQALGRVLAEPGEALLVWSVGEPGSACAEPGSGPRFSRHAVEALAGADPGASMAELMGRTPPEEGPPSPTVDAFFRTR